MIALARRLVAAPAFERWLIALIVLNGIIVGLETNAGLAASFGGLFEFLDHAILAIFVAEAGIKIAARWPRPQDYFTDGWNLFDFGIIVLSLLPASGEFATVARLIRLLRVLRLVTALPKLRLMVATLVRCIPGMGHVLSLMALLFYVYGIAGYHLYAQHDPERWGTLGRALLTLFQIATLEAWTDIMHKAMGLGTLHWLYFVSFVLLGTFVVVNLFVAVVINSLEESHQEMAEADARRLTGTVPDALNDLRAVRSALAELDRRMQGIEQVLAAEREQRAGR